MAEPTDFFLDEVKGDFWTARPAMSSASSVTRLIDGFTIYSNQEEALLGAKESVLLTSWAFDPLLPISSSKVPSVVLNWGRLLLGLAKDGISIRILMSDQDPVFQPDAHGLFWSRWLALLQAANTLSLPPEKFQVMVARHPASWGLTLVRRIAGDKFLDDIVAALGKLGEADRNKLLRVRPGLWDKVALTKTGIAVNPASSGWPAFPGSHHQKLLLIDEDIAFIGGINHIPENIDDQKHVRLPKLPWHDGCVRVEGAVVMDIVSDAYGHWNDCWPRAKAFIEDANKLMPAFALPFRSLSDLKPKKRSKPPATGKIPAQPWRTLCRAISIADVTDTTRADIIEGYLKAIGLAEKFIYIENQYLREQRLADALIKRLKTIPALNLIILLPSTAEELIDKEGDEITKTGAALQYDIIDSLTKAFGRNIGIFSLFNQEKKKRMIYVHNKVMIVDDLFATLGSANTNPRSFDLDTELNLAWVDSGSVAALRRYLWREMLGPDSGADGWKPKQYAAKWLKIAKANDKAAGPKQQGFIVPFKNEAKGSKNPFVPDWLTLADPPPADPIA